MLASYVSNCVALNVTDNKMVSFCDTPSISAPFVKIFDRYHI